MGSFTSIDRDKSLTTCRHLGVWLAIKLTSNLSIQFRPVRREGFSAGEEEDLSTPLIGPATNPRLLFKPIQLLTGEWIIYLRHDAENYYLCCGAHKDGDQ